MKYIFLLFLFAPTLHADQLRINSSADWNAWTLPGDAIVVEDGRIQPSFVRRDINAVANAGDFDGGIRGVGSNPQSAANLIDGDKNTYWSPNTNAPAEDWWIEIDLGRVVSARYIELHFAEDGAPMEFFKILTSDGEPFFNNANSIIPGTLRYNKRTRYSFNQDRVIRIDFDDKPLRYVRVEADRIFKEVVYFPALLILAIVVVLQKRRARNERPPGMDEAAPA